MVKSTFLCEEAWRNAGFNCDNHISKWLNAPQHLFHLWQLFPSCQCTPEPCNRDPLLPTHCPGAAAKEQLVPSYSQNITLS